VPVFRPHKQNTTPQNINTPPVPHSRAQINPVIMGRTYGRQAFYHNLLTLRTCSVSRAIANISRLTIVWHEHSSKHCISPLHMLHFPRGDTLKNAVLAYNLGSLSSEGSLESTAGPPCPAHPAYSVNQ